MAVRRAGRAETNLDQPGAPLLTILAGFANPFAKPS